MRWPRKKQGLADDAWRSQAGCTVTSISSTNATLGIVPVVMPISKRSMSECNCRRHRYRASPVAVAVGNPTTERNSISSYYRSFMSLPLSCISTRKGCMQCRSQVHCPIGRVENNSSGSLQSFDDGVRVVYRLYLIAIVSILPFDVLLVSLCCKPDCCHSPLRIGGLLLRIRHT